MRNGGSFSPSREPPSCFLLDSQYLYPSFQGAYVSREKGVRYPTLGYVITPVIFHPIG